MDLILKEQMENVNHVTVGFSPRDGEVILKDTIGDATTTHTVFQSPQWG